MKGYVSLFYRLIPLVTVLFLITDATVFSETRQQYVHKRSPMVMPFTMSKTLHIFKMTESGGVLKIVVRKPDDNDQIALIQRHLKHEAGLFRKGDYSDPAKLHGDDMPGLKDLQGGSSRIAVTCLALPEGAEITFKTDDLHLLTALHKWFGAQLSEHGADARAE
jgi:hypothetical protein